MNQGGGERGTEYFLKGDRLRVGVVVARFFISRIEVDGRTN